MNIVIVDKNSAEDIARLAVCLTQEIIQRTGIQHFAVDVPKAITLCRNYIELGYYTVFAAKSADKDGEKIIGFTALHESHSLYAEGAFGIIQEFYVLSDYRSQQIGTQLIHSVVEFAREKNWKRLEVCTPPVPEFDNTVSFYKANGFEITGGYKMKRSVI
jgi:GNAT superfamily N-acetyltransferase